jgi:hypothetical protein
MSMNLESSSSCLASISQEGQKKDDCSHSHLILLSSIGDGVLYSKVEALP